MKKAIFIIAIILIMLTGCKSQPVSEVSSQAVISVEVSSEFDSDISSETSSVKKVEMISSEIDSKYTKHDFSSLNSKSELTRLFAPSFRSVTSFIQSEKLTNSVPGKVTILEQLFSAEESTVIKYCVGDENPNKSGRTYKKPFLVSFIRSLLL